ncbi:MAG: VPDSG-CTERM sorting domain-containing protein [Opitutaceae bacterium]|nr:VPDSG-CTERM sorting domain-containing protein [Opitutaceae bacterium]
MKFASIALGLLAVVSTASAGMYTFTPNPSDLGDLDHHTAVAWGITGTAGLQSQLASGYRISGATICIENIWDWKVEQDKLFINLLDDPKTGVRTYSDNTNDNVLSNFFTASNSSSSSRWNGQSLLTTWTDPKGGSNGAFAIDYTYNFGSADLALLTSYLSDPTASNRAAFGLGFDPDCHYYNDGIKLIIYTEKISIPDAGSTVLMLGLGLGALVAIRRRTLRS